MIQLELTRLSGTSEYTFGVMRERMTGFSCRTMERRDPLHWQGIKNYCAVPAGKYKLRFIARDNLKLNLQLAVTGTYRNAELTSESVPYSLSAGSICVGKVANHEKGLLEGGEVVLDGIDAWIKQLICDGYISTKIKTGEMELVVKYAECYYYDNRTKNKQKEKHHEAEAYTMFDFAE